MWKVEVETGPGTNVWNDYTAITRSDSVAVASVGGRDAGTSSATLVDTPGTAVVAPECGWRVTDGTTVIFRGLIKKRGKSERRTRTRYKWYDITAQDATSLLVDDVVDVNGLRTGSRSDKAEVEWLLTTFGTKGITTGAAIQNTGTISREIDYTGMNLFEALTEAAKWLTVKFYVAVDLALHWYNTESNSAPFNLSDNPNNTTTFGYDGFDFPDDSLDLVNAVFVIGAEGVGEWVTNSASITAYGRKEAAFQDAELADSAARVAAGNAILAKYALPRGPIKIVVYKPGLRADQNIQITNATWGLSAVTYRIQEVNATINGNTSEFRYAVTLQDAPVTLSNVVSGGFDRAHNDIDRSTNNAIGYAEQFLIGRVKVVSVLPTLPDPDYPIGSQVFLTVDEKLYRNPDNVAWTAAVNLPDGVGKITGTQISDEAISAPHILANSIGTSHLAAGAVTADQIAANAIQAGHITAGAIGAEALAAEIVLADTLLTTGLSGRRIEIDDEGVRAYSASEQLLVNIPTVGSDPVSVVGEIEAASLIATGAAELRGQNILNAGSTTTLQVGVVDPPTAPVVSVALPGNMTMATAPPNVGHGLCYDPLGGSGLNTPVYYVGANPEVGNLLDLAYEYRASDGVLLRTFRKTGTTTVQTDTIGSTSHVSDSVEATSLDDQVSTPLTIPSGRSNPRATKVSAYFYGYGGSGTGRVAIWSNGGTLLKVGSQMSIPSKAMDLGGSTKFSDTFSTPESLTAGNTYRVGFLRDDGGGLQWDRDDGSGKTTYKGNGGQGNYASSSTDSSHKPNVYMTYQYDVDASVEGAVGKIIGVARITGSDILWVLDDNGMLYKYVASTMAYVTKINHDTNITGANANAGLFYDGTNLVIVTAAGQTGTDQVRFVKLDKTSGAFVSNNTATGTNTINGGTATTRGGVLNGGNYWISINSIVTTYSASTYAFVANNEFGDTTSTTSGVTHDGTYFRGWSSGVNPTKVWRFSNWTWASAVMDFWVCYSWYDITGTTHETKVSPRLKVTPGRRKQITVSNPAIPGASTEPPDRVRVYMVQSATDPGGTAYKLQSTDALVTRTFTDYNAAGAASSASNTFPVGSAAILRSVSTSPGWELRGDGYAKIDGVAAGYAAFAAPPGWAATNVQTSSVTLPANGGARAFLLHVPSPMRLWRYLFYNPDTSGARTAEFRLFRDVGADALVFVTGTDVAYSFTPASAGRRYTNAVSGADVLLAPGMYWLCCRNTHATNTLALGYVAGGTLGPALNRSAPTTTPALGATLDISGWNDSDALFAMLALGEVFAGTAWAFV